MISKPEGLMAPEGVAEGEAFEVLATVVVHGDHVTVVKLDGQVVPGYEKDAEKIDKGEKVPREGGGKKDYVQETTERASKEMAGEEGY